MSEPLLSFEDVTIAFPGADGRVPVVREVSFALEPGRCLVIVGESGSGKSMCCQAILGITPASATVTGRIRFAGRDLLSASREEWRAIRGAEIAMIFQDPTASLNPLMPVGRQIVDVVRAHRRCSAAEAKARAVEVLTQVEFPDPEQRMKSYPSQLSGGLRQRVVIAMALACEPSLIVADEPTTNLDVSIQAQILKLLRRLKDELGLSILFVTHDLGVAAEIGEDILVLYAGHALERGSVREVLTNPCHPYTVGLLRSAPTLKSRRAVPLRAIPGQAPDPAAIGEGAPFRHRCEVVVPDLCEREKPGWTPCGNGHAVACHRYAADGAEGVR